MSLMKHHNSIFSRANRGILAIVICFALGFVGCNSQPATSTAGASGDKAHHDHDHPSEGPHHGELIDLGKDEFHAELVQDEATHTVTIYVLDAAAKEVVPIDATELALNLLVAGKPQQFKLAARPTSGEPAGKASCFVLSDKALCEAIDTKGTTGRLNIPINGKAFVGKIAAHDHDHK
jgi:hypothetical protein